MQNIDERFSALKAQLLTAERRIEELTAKVGLPDNDEGGAPAPASGWQKVGDSALTGGQTITSPTVPPGSWVRVTFTRDTYDGSYTSGGIVMINFGSPVLWYNVAPTGCVVTVSGSRVIAGYNSGGAVRCLMELLPG